MAEQGGPEHWSGDEGDERRPQPAALEERVARLELEIAALQRKIGAGPVERNEAWRAAPAERSAPPPAPPPMPVTGDCERCAAAGLRGVGGGLVARANDVRSRVARVVGEPPGIAYLQPHCNRAAADRDGLLFEAGGRSPVDRAQPGGARDCGVAGRRGTGAVVGTLPAQGLCRVFLLAEGGGQRRALSFAVGGVSALRPDSCADGDGADDPGDCVERV